MINFEDLNAGKIADLYRNKKEADIEVSTEVTGFGNSEDFNIPKEVPPSPMILTKEGLTEVILHGGTGIKSLFMQFVVFSYAYGGRIYYSKLPSGKLLAKLSWPVA